MNIYQLIEKEFERIFGDRDEEEQTELRERLKQAKASPRNSQKPKVKDSIIKTDRRMYAPSTDVEKVEQAMDGLEILLINDPASRRLPQAYWFTHTYFPIDEIDGQEVWELSVEKTGNGSNGFVLTDSKGEQVYTKYVCAVVIDKEGRYGRKGAVIGAADGIFEANSSTNALYLSHIATLPAARRAGIASALENAMLAKCHEYAQEAEQRLGVKYKKNKTGTKVQALTLEIEFASLADEDSVKATVGRHIFHGKNGVSVCETRSKRKSGARGGVRYCQPDTTVDPLEPFDPKTNTSVPLYLGIRLLGREKTREIPSDEARGYLDLMYAGFIMQEMNPDAVEADRRYSQQRIRGRYVTMHQLPQNVDEAVEFVRQEGDAYRILTTVYRGHNFTLQNADEMRATIKPEQVRRILH